MGVPIFTGPNAQIPLPQALYLNIVNIHCKDRGKKIGNFASDLITERNVCESLIYPTGVEVLEHGIFASK